MAARKSSTGAASPAPSNQPVAMAGNARQNAMQTLQMVATRDLQQKQTEQRELLAYYRNEEKVEVSISPMYRPYFGNVMPIGVNGCTVFVPVDGRKYKVPKTFVRQVASRIRKVDDQVKRQGRMADVQNNYDGKDMNLSVR